MSTDHKTESVRRAQQQSSDPSRMADALVAEGWTPPPAPEPPASPIVVSEEAIGHLEGVADECVPLDQMRRVAKLLFKVMLRDNLKALELNTHDPRYARLRSGSWVHRADLYKALTGEEWPG